MTDEQLLEICRQDQEFRRIKVRYCHTLVPDAIYGYGPVDSQDLRWLVDEIERLRNNPELDRVEFEVMSREMTRRMGDKNG